MSEKEINKEQLQKEIDQELNSTILAMAQDPSNADNYHTLAKLYAMDNLLACILMPIYDNHCFQALDN